MEPVGERLLLEIATCQALVVCVLLLPGALADDPAQAAMDFVWAERANIPTPRFAGAAVVVKDHEGNDRILVLGGIVGNSPSSTVEEYDPSRDVWTERAGLDCPRFGFGAAVLDNEVYIIGGGHYSLTAVNKYDPWGGPLGEGIDQRQSADMPTPRYGLAIAVATSAEGDKRIYAIGGYCPETHRYVCTVEEYDPDGDGGKGSWNTEVADLHFARANFAVAVLNNKIYVFGGYNETGRLCSVEEYDPVEDVWRHRADMPTPRDYLTATVFNDKIYVIGGYYGKKDLAIVEEYDPQTDTWTQKTCIPTKIRGHCAAVASTRTGLGSARRLYVISGKSTGEPLTSVYEGTLQEIHNRPPRLDWTGERGFESDAVDPDRGDPDTAFEFRVKYSDPDGDPPLDSFPYLHVMRGDVEIPESWFCMYSEDLENAGWVGQPGDYVSGRIYHCYVTPSPMTALPANYSYYVECYDSNGAPAIGGAGGPQQEPVPTVPTNRKAGPAVQPSTPSKQDTGLYIESISAKPLAGAGTVEVSFSARASGSTGPYSYSWDFDDSDGIQVDSFRQNSTFVYANPGAEPVRYTVTLTVSDIYGQSASETTTVTVYPRHYVRADPICYTGVEDVVIEGFEIAGFGGWGTDATHAIQIINCSNVTIRNCYVHDGRGDALALVVKNSHAVVVENNCFEHNSAGIWFENCTDCSLTGNIFREGGGRCCYVSSSRRFEVAGNVIRDWGIPEFWHNGIDFENVVDSSIHDNFICNVAGHGMGVLFGSSRIDVFRNTVRHAHEEALWLADCSHISVYENFFKPICGWGINMVDAPATNNRIFNNILCGDGRMTQQKCWFAASSRAWEGCAGIHVASGASGNLIYNNVLHDVVGIALICIDSEPDMPPTANNVVKNNIISNQRAVHLEDRPDCAQCSTNRILYNDLYVPEENTVHEVFLNVDGNIRVDPQFRDPSNENFMLKSTSPCIDKGDPDDDYSNEPEPNGGRINMGAFGNTPQAVRSMMNRAPGTPVCLYPLDGASNVPVAATLRWNCTDPDGDPVTYTIYLDAHDAKTLVCSGIGTTTYSPDLDYNTTYFWRVVADDGVNQTESNTWSFTTLAETVVPVHQLFPRSLLLLLVTTGLTRRRR